ncbi:P-loop containing nucleoside triphosphate hydrolase protein, partial [Jimgerdemannia flammicorona]
MRQPVVRQKLRRRGFNRELNLLQSRERWQCQIKLRRNDELDDFGPVIYVEEHAADAVWRAQKALLNPSKDMTIYVQESFDKDERDELNCSALGDAIVIYITGPKPQDVHGSRSCVRESLSIIDLPGLIANREASTRALSESIERMIRRYVSDPDAVIIPVLTAFENWEQYGIWQIVEQADPNGTRTLPVFTKPDRVEQDTHHQLLAIIKGEIRKHKNALGYWIVKNPPQHLIKSAITFQRGRELEMEFFNRSTDEWKLPQYDWLQELPKDRCGIDGLRPKLSGLLVESLKRNIPEIKRRLLERRASILEELKNLGPISHEDVSLEIYARVNIKKARLLMALNQFVSAVKIDVEESIFNEAIWAFRVYENKMYSTRPVFDVGNVKLSYLQRGAHLPTDGIYPNEEDLALPPWTMP